MLYRFIYKFRGKIFQYSISRNLNSPEYAK